MSTWPFSHASMSGATPFRSCGVSSNGTTQCQPRASQVATPTHATREDLRLEVYGRHMYSAAAA